MRPEIVIPTTEQRTAQPSGSGNLLNAMYCDPKSAAPGAEVTCELKLSPGANETQLTVSSSSGQVKVPGKIMTRSNGSSLTFLVSIEPTARHEIATITASSGTEHVEDMIEVIPTGRPVLMAPRAQVARIGEPINFPVMAMDAADLPVQLAASELPAGASFDKATGAFSWVPDEAQIGKHEIVFRATNSAGISATSRVTIDVGSGVPVLAQERPLSCSPNSVASIAGRWLATSGEERWDPAGATIELGGTKVQINRQYVPVVFRSIMRVDFLCPPSPPGSDLSVVVETAAGQSMPLAGTMRSVSPRILSIDGSGENQGVITFADTGDLAMFRNYRVASKPAQPGDEVLIWATGLGSEPLMLAQTLSVKLGDTDTPVLSIQPVPDRPGIYTVRISIPASVSTGDRVPVRLSLWSQGGKVSSNIVWASLETANR